MDDNILLTERSSNNFNMSGQTNYVKMDGIQQKQGNYNYSDVFAESYDTTLPDSIKEFYDKAYKAVYTVIYVLLSVTFGAVLLVFYSILLAINSFCLTWFLGPCFKCQEMCFERWGKYITKLLDCYLGPYFRICGSCCSRMVVRYQQVPGDQVIHV